MSDLGEMLNFSFAEDIESEWDVYMEEGYTIQEATTQIIDQYEDMLDEEESIALYVTLGVIQMALEEMDPRVKREINEIIGTKTLEMKLDKAYIANVKKTMSLKSGYACVATSNCERIFLTSVIKSSVFEILKRRGRSASPLK